MATEIAVPDPSLSTDAEAAALAAAAQAAAQAAAAIDATSKAAAAQAAAATDATSKADAARVAAQSAAQAYADTTKRARFNDRGTQTAPVTLAAWDSVTFDLTSSTVIQLLPSSPAVGDEVEYYVSALSGTNKLTVTGTGGPFTIVSAGHGAVARWTGSAWVERQDRKTKASLDAVYAKQSAWFGRNIKRSGEVFPVMSSPPTIAALATTSGITSARSINSTNPGGTVFRDDFWRYLGASRPKVFPTNNSYVIFDSFTLPSGNPVGHYSVEFYHYGTQVEFKLFGNFANYQILVDDQLVQAIPFSLSNTGSSYFQLITFGTAAVRKIRLRGLNTAFGGVNIGPTDQIWPTEKRGPRVVILGDSFTGGSNSAAGALTSWASYLAETMGWYDVYHAYAGGSGYTVAGQGVTFANRVANDVVANSPDIVILAGGHNDDGVATPSAISSAASSLLSTIAAGLPNALIVVSSEFWARGPSTWPNSIFDNKAALKAAAAAAGAPFVDVMEIPITRTPASGTLSSQANAGATTFSTSSTRPIVGSLVHIGGTTTGSTWDRARVTNVTGGGPFTVTLNVALNNTQASGTAWTEVGECWSDGAGYVTAATGGGPSDVFCSSDGVHPSDAGHSALGRIFAGQLAAIGLHY